MSYLERMQPFDVVYGFDVNRITEALTNLRGANIPLISSYAICFGYQPVDTVSKARCRFWVTPNVDTVIKVYLSFTLQPFHVGNQTTAAATATSTSSTTSSAQPHQHSWVAHSNSSPAAPIGTDGAGNPRGPAYGFLTGTDATVNGVPSFSTFTTIDAAGTGHTHNIPSLNVNIPSLTLNPPSAIYEAGMAQGVHLFIDGVDQTSGLGGPWGVGSAIDISALDVTQFIQSVGWHEFQLSSTSIGGLTVQAQYQSLINSSL